MEKKCITNTDLEEIYNRAKTMWLERHNAEYESRLWVVLCYVKAYCAWAGLEQPKEIYRDFYGPEDYAEYLNPEATSEEEPKK